MAEGGSDLFGIPFDLFGGGAAALGAGADAYSFSQQLQRQQALQKIYEMLQNPQKLAAYAGQLMPQYSPAATGAFNRGVNANWASMTGGAPGGAAAQFSADAWAKLISSDWFNALSGARGALGGATGAIPGAPQGGNLGSIMQSLAALQRIRQGGGGGGGLISGFPASGGGGGDYAGSSDQLRSAFPAPAMESAYP